MRRAAVLFTMAVVIIWAPIVVSTPLIDAYNAALPGAGYDKMVVLDPGVTYTGGLNIIEGNVCIISYGAEIDLQGGQIIIDPAAILDICGVVIDNGVNNDQALKYGTGGRGWVDHCTFYNNYNSVYFWDDADMVLTSNIFSYATHYGVYTHTDAVRWMAFNDAYHNISGHYKEWCPG
ncbi:MAG: hypothetical protein HQ591_05845 [candidate division Zixibacteria bacterium]|nr:hypothetical protein [Candidatus Tariuqbacter arcticus]